MPIEAADMDEATERLRCFLRDRRLRVTAERLALLQVVLRTEGHFDADKMVARVRRGRGKVSRATIYRTLGLLERCGILRRSPRTYGRGLYETALGRRPHDHIFCAKCGRIEEFYEERVERIQRSIARRLGYRILEHVHEIVGLCRECRRAAGAAER
jgi:Fur family ferric uptake transcriptional regulator